MTDINRITDVIEEYGKLIESMQAQQAQLGTVSKIAFIRQVEGYAQQLETILPRMSTRQWELLSELTSSQAAQRKLRESAFMKGLT